MNHLRYQTNRSSQSGLSMIEIMIAMALSAVIIGGVTRVYIENSRNFSHDEEVARLQENGRFAVNILKRELKMAGFYADQSGGSLGALGGGLANGCGGGLDTWSLDAGGVDFVADAPGGVPVSVRGQSLATCINAAIEPGTDVLVVKRTKDRPSLLDGVRDITIPNAGDEKTDAWYLAVTQSPFSVQNVYVPIGGFDVALTDTGLPIVLSIVGMEVWLHDTKIYWVRNYARNPGDGIPTLMVSKMDGNTYDAQALIEGVEMFHVEFGLNDPAATDPTPVAFTPNPTVAELDTVSVVRFYLLMRSKEEIYGYTNDKTYTLGTMPAFDPVPDDGFARRVFSSTVFLRNN